MAKASFLQIQQDYENIVATDLDISSKYDILTSALIAKANGTSGATTIQDAYSPIVAYYNTLTRVNGELQDYVSTASTSIASLSESGDRYTNRTHPEESVLPREPTRGLMPELRVRTLPYLLAVSVFMASLTIFLIFQMFGFSGQVNLPPSISAWLSSPASSVPFYMNPMVLGGISIILIVALIIFATLYFKSRNTNNK